LSSLLVLFDRLRGISGYESVRSLPEAIRRAAAAAEPSASAVPVLPRIICGCFAARCPSAIGIAMGEHCFVCNGNENPSGTWKTHPSGFRGMTHYLVNFITDKRVA